MKTYNRLTLFLLPLAFLLVSCNDDNPYMDMPEPSESPVYMHPDGEYIRKIQINNLNRIEAINPDEEFNNVDTPYPEKVIKNDWVTIVHKWTLNKEEIVITATENTDSKPRVYIIYTYLGAHKAELAIIQKGKTP